MAPQRARPASLLAVGACAAVAVLAPAVAGQRLVDDYVPRTPPRTFAWEEFNAALLRPAATLTATTEREYYALPERPIYRSYPVYHPSRQPAGYLRWLSEQEPEVVVAGRTMSAADWRTRGETVFDTPIRYEPFRADAPVGDSDSRLDSEVPVASDGTIPFVRYVIRKRGVIELGTGACAMCHTRITPTGSVMRGGAGHSAVVAALFARDADYAAEASATSRLPNLIGVANMHYLGAGGILKHRGIGDLMRFVALEHWGRHTLPASATSLGDGGRRSRYSDDDLYAVAWFLRSLKPIPNPHHSDELAARGAVVFEREGCNSCHPPPLFTNNRLLAAETHLPASAVVTAVTGETDRTHALAPERATKLRRIPSLIGWWFRDEIEMQRSSNGVGQNDREVGELHLGPTLSDADRTALIAFLRTL